MIQGTESLTPHAEAIMLSWTRHHGRSEGLAAALGIPAIFVDGEQGNVLVRYFRQWHQTRQFLRTLPTLKKIVLMMPPFPALIAVILGSSLQVAGDLHTGVFNDPKWRYFLPFTARILRRRGIGIVTNTDLAQELEGRGVQPIVLHDQITDTYVDDNRPFESGELEAIDQSDSDWLLVPLAYAYDEPLDQILEAGRLTQELTWVLTGSAPSKYMKDAPSNVVFPGYISDADFRRAVNRASAIAALTTDENTMQRAGYEAMSVSQALFTTPMKVLKGFFEEAAVYAEPSPKSLAAGAKQVISEAAERREAMASVRSRRYSEQEEALTELRQWLAE